MREAGDGKKRKQSSSLGEVFWQCRRQSFLFLYKAMAPTLTQVKGMAAGDEGRAAVGPTVASPRPCRSPGKGSPIMFFVSHFQL